MVHFLLPLLPSTEVCIYSQLWHKYQKALWKIYEWGIELQPKKVSTVVFHLPKGYVVGEWSIPNFGASLISHRFGLEDVWRMCCSENQWLSCIYSIVKSFCTDPLLLFLSSCLNVDKELLENDNSLVGCLFFVLFCFFPGTFLEIPLWLEVLLCEIYLGLHLARNYVRAHFCLFEELQETLCINKSGHFSRKHSGGMCLLLLSFPDPEINLIYEYQQESTHPLATPGSGKYPHQPEKKKRRKNKKKITSRLLTASHFPLLCALHKFLLIMIQSNMLM